MPLKIVFFSLALPYKWLLPSSMLILYVFFASLCVNFNQLQSGMCRLVAFAENAHRISTSVTHQPNV